MGGRLGGARRKPSVFLEEVEQSSCVTLGKSFIFSVPRVVFCKAGKIVTLPRVAGRTDKGGCDPLSPQRRSGRGCVGWDSGSRAWSLERERGAGGGGGRWGRRLSGPHSRLVGKDQQRDV